MMKRLLLLLLCAALLSGCMLYPAAPEETEPEPTETETIPTTEETVTEPETEPPVVLPADYDKRENPVEIAEGENIIPFYTGPGFRAGDQALKDHPDLFKNAPPKRILYEAETFEITADYGTYLVAGFQEKFVKLMQAVEKATGIPFNNSERKLWTQVENYKNGDDDFAYGFFADAQNRLIQLGQAEAFIGKNSGMVMSMARVNLHDGLGFVPVPVLDSGFQVYTAYRAIENLKQTDPALAAGVVSPNGIFEDYLLRDPELFFGQSMEYWLENGYPMEMSNGDWSLGFMLMLYLDEECGGYTLWLTDFDKTASGNPAAQIQHLKKVYGEEVFTGFCKWIAESLPSFQSYAETDYTWLKEWVYYPTLQYDGYNNVMFIGKYSDLCVALDEFRHYLTNVKDYAIGNMTLIKDTDAPVSLYGPNGEFLMTTRGIPVGNSEYHVFLDGVSYVKFLGEGSAFAGIDCEIAAG